MKNKDFDELVGLIKLELVNIAIETNRALKKIGEEGVSRWEFYNFMKKFNERFRILEKLIEMEGDQDERKN